jgi:hypothetical protein
MLNRGIQFGDLPGHEFHGNQWVLGQIGEALGGGKAFSPSPIYTDHSNGSHSLTVGARSGSHAASMAAAARQVLKQHGFKQVNDSFGSKRGGISTHVHPDGRRAEVTHTVMNASPGRMRVTMQPSLGHK